jgi:ribosome-associated protein
MSKQETRHMVLAAATVCEEKKAEDVRILELDPIDSAFTDFFLICSGANARQNQTIAEEIELRLKREFGALPNSVEGLRQAEWILLDYVDFVVHIFAADKRAFYDIERLRKSASPVALDALKRSLTEKVTAVRKKTARPAGPARKAAKTTKTVAKKATGKSVAAAKTKKKATPAAPAKKAAAKRAPAKKTVRAAPKKK